MVDSECYRATGNYGTIQNAVFIGCWKNCFSLCGTVVEKVEKGRAEDIKSTGQEISRHDSFK